MPDVSIVYCRPCGYEKRAKAAADVLRERLGIEAKLVPGTGRIFQVRVGDKTVAERASSHFPGADEIVEAVAAARG